ncbi:class I SAM-dependent methyltransferase [Lusitaniella coriacea]|uniref:class I SAM-dependent methyltransferase n=1 Tax=Lusitaniella coriacea TaxID=1983105 RepID=UPI003CF14F9C
MPRTGFFLSSPKQSYPQLELSFEFCPQCALIRRQLLREDPPDYTEVNRKTDRQLPDYAHQIARSFEKANVGVEELVVEIGANDGEFLSFLAKAGYNNRLAVEPSMTLANVCSNRGHQVWNAHLDVAEALKIKEACGFARVVICRHTLEHVPDPQGLLLAMRSLLSEDGLLFLEVPDARVIIRDLQGHELWDEHLYYFTSENLSSLLQRSRFHVEEMLVLRHRSSANILCWSRPSQQESSPNYSKYKPTVELCHNFRDRWFSLAQHLQAERKNWSKPIVAIGASHLQSNFLQFADLIDEIDLFVDDDPIKVGQYVPLQQPIPIVSTEQLLNRPLPGTIIRTAFGYESWMDKICQPLAQKGVQIVEPYDSLVAVNG